MAENKRRPKHIITLILCVIITIIAAVLLLCQIPAVQTKMAAKAVGFLNETIGGNISFDECHIQPFNTIVVTNLLIDGGPCDTAIYAKSVVLQFGLRSLISKTPCIHKGTVYEGGIFLKFDERGFNLTRVFPEVETIRTGKVIFRISNVIADDFKVYVSGLGENLEFKLSTDLNTTNLKIKDNGTEMKIERLSAIDTSGFTIENLRTKLRADQTGIEIDDFSFSDTWSDISIPHFLAEFGNIVSFDGRIRNTLISSNTASKFIPAFSSTPIELSINNLRINGPLNDLNLSTLTFSEHNLGISANLQCRAKNLPDIQKAKFDLTVKEACGTYNGTRLSFEGKASGPVNDLQASGLLSNGTGTFHADLSVKNILSQAETFIGGKIKTVNFNIGQILGVKTLGECSVEAEASASLGKGLNFLKVNSLIVDKLHLLDYDYSTILGSGTFADESFDGDIICYDKNLNFVFKGLCNLGKNVEEPVYNFHLDLPYANMQELKLDKRGVSKGTLEMNADFTGKLGGNLLGNIDILNLKLENGDGVHDIGDIHIDGRTSRDEYNLNFISEFLTGSYKGSESFEDLVGDLKNITINQYLPSIIQTDYKEREEKDFQLELDFHDSRDLLSFVYPGLYIADSTKVGMGVTKDGQISASVISSRIALNKNYLKDFNLGIDNNAGFLSIVTNSEENKIAGMTMKNNSILAYAQDDMVGLSFEFDNGTEVADRAAFLLSGVLGRNDGNILTLNAQNAESEIVQEGNVWKIAPAKYCFSKKGIKIDSLSLQNGKQSMIVDGGFSKSEPDTLHIMMNSFDLGMLSMFMGETLNFAGIATGNAEIRTPTSDNFGLEANLSIAESEFSHLPLGLVNIRSNWDEEEDKISFRVVNNLEGKRTIDFSGDFIPESKSIVAEAALDSFNAGYSMLYQSQRIMRWIHLRTDSSYMMMLTKSCI